MISLLFLAYNLKGVQELSDITIAKVYPFLFVCVNEFSQHLYLQFKNSNKINVSFQQLAVLWCFYCLNSNDNPDNR